MTVEQTKVVDFISIDRVTDEVILSISDHLEWDEANEHLLLLQDKLNSYLAFVESGELLRSYPSANGRSVSIKLMYKYPPILQAKDFLDHVAPIIRGAGIEFTHRLLQE